MKTYTQQKYFKTGLKLNMAGNERLDELFSTSQKHNDSKEQLIKRISLVFDIKGQRLTKFVNNNLNL